MSGSVPPNNGLVPAYESALRVCFQALLAGALAGVPLTIVRRVQLMIPEAGIGFSLPIGVLACNCLTLAVWAAALTLLEEVAARLNRPKLLVGVGSLVFPYFAGATYLWFLGLSEAGPARAVEETWAWLTLAPGLYLRSPLRESLFSIGTFLLGFVALAGLRRSRFDSERLGLHLGLLAAVGTLCATFNWIAGGQLVGLGDQLLALGPIVPLLGLGMVLGRRVATRIADRYRETSACL